jgi:hypothetical protein
MIDEREELAAIDNEDALTLEPEFFEAPIPGESLTSDPSNPKAYEQPPQFNTAEEATHQIFMTLTEEDNYEEVIDALTEGVPLDVLTQVFLFKGFQEGQWSVDLMILLTEPTIYILMWIADQAGIEAQIDSDGDDWDDEEEERMKGAIQKDIDRMKPPKEQMSPSLLAKMDEYTEEKARGEK